MYTVEPLYSGHVHGTNFGALRLIIIGEAFIEGTNHSCENSYCKNKFKCTSLAQRITAAISWWTDLSLD